jgi:ATP-dependent RNA helicase SUPV3L1/SUV3
MPMVTRRLEQFGVPKQDIPTLLKAFRDSVSDGLLTRPGIQEKYTLDRFAGAFTGTHNGRTDEVLTNIFYSWASDPDHQSFLETIVPPSTLNAITQLRAAADHSYPANSFKHARSIRRKFYMHVGPTNSGKTHMALRALAAAQTGVYAGPLRLLAHEVWERLNKGQIVPLGVDPDDDAEPDMETGIDTMGVDNSERPTLRKQGNPKYVRECNMITGEEMKIVSDDATLVSCTIEMLTTTRLYDVAVVDEIQMIGDSDRGGAWSRAVLGLFAKEIHLCGEETAIPVIRALVNEMGDELVINRYARLTPLVLQEQTLEGDFGRVQKGDCIVTFTRTGIFALKRQVEERTGMRCAVAYGRLPPELRSEQAALFNDPNSGYDVMIASDAIGMGLNL